MSEYRRKARGHATSPGSRACLGVAVGQSSPRRPGVGPVVRPPSPEKLKTTERVGPCRNSDIMSE
eukprot:scaffold1684_cov60-Phaeocystis_antarctica.AAC.1